MSLSTPTGPSDATKGTPVAAVLPQHPEEFVLAQRKVLIAEVRDIVGLPNDGDDGSRPVGDVAEAGFAAEQLTVSIGINNHKGRRLGEIDAALHAMRIGAYGVCMSCKPPTLISQGRLQILASAERCLKCQLAYEESSSEAESPQTIDPAALRAMLERESGKTSDDVLDGRDPRKMPL